MRHSSLLRRVIVISFKRSDCNPIKSGWIGCASFGAYFSEMMLGNIHEVMNVCSRLFMDANSPHLRLDTVYASLSDAPESVPEIINVCQGRVDCNVEIPNYGCGNRSFLST